MKFFRERDLVALWPVALLCVAIGAGVAVFAPEKRIDTAGAASTATR
jgi:hypothetical protein